jgi:CBS domain-containing protein
MCKDGLIRRSAATVPVGVSVHEAARLMKENAVGLILVLDGGRIAGILTEGDIVGAVAEGLDYETTMVDELIGSDPVCLPAGSELAECLHRERTSATGSVDWDIAFPDEQC